MLEDQSTVLLVEDEPLIRLFIAELLEDAGFRVVEAANATEALVILEAGLSVDVMLTDVEMPSGCSGFELARRVHESWPSAEILIMSGRQWPESGDLPPGAAFLAKPCPNEAIVSHVLSAAERTKAAPVPSEDREGNRGGAVVLPFSKSA